MHLQWLCLECITYKITKNAQINHERAVNTSVSVNI